MIRVGLISNPRSQRNKRNMPAMREVVRAHPDVLHAELDHVEGTAPVLRDFARREVGVVAVSGGDGTVQKVMTELLNGGGFGQQPRLAVLPSGMTNLIAADVGLRGNPARSLARLCAAAAASAPTGEALPRPVISMQRIPTEAPVHGMFLGTAAFYRGIKLARDRVHPLGAEQTLAAAMGLGLALLRLVAGRGDGNALMRAERMAIGIGGGKAVTRDYLLFMATTLQRLILGVMPFWGAGDGGLRMTTVDFPPQRFCRAILPILRGRPREWMEAGGYRSGRASECRLTLNCPIVFDGEFFTPEPETPVVLRADREIAFWRC